MNRQPVKYPPDPPITQQDIEEWEKVIEKRERINAATYGKKLYRIVDKNGVQMPDHYEGRFRTFHEAKKMVKTLNRTGEYKPYKMIEV